MKRLIPLILLSLAAFGQAQNIPSPKSFFGHDVCEDYWLANYTELSNYWHALAKASNRIKVVEIGKSQEGRPQFMSIISDPDNHRELDKYFKIAKRLAMAKDDTTNEAALALAKTGKAIVWIDGGLHATEVLGAQQLLETAHQLVSRNDEENARILRDCIVLLVHANPDGMDLVSNWYMRRNDRTTRSLGGLPRLYQHYCGHDNNRDFYANNTAESKNMSRVMYLTHFPQIVYNHHQTSPRGTIMFIPPFRNPFNYHVDPLVQVATDVVGMHMHQRLISEGKGGTVMREGAGFSTWWNGGLRTTTYFHNMVGILTETFGSPNPTNAPWVGRFQVPSIDIPKPLDPGPWKLRDSLGYEVSANYAILDYASRYKEKVQFNVWRAARNNIEKAQRDSWTRYPARLEKHGQESLRMPELRDARAYILPSDQPDFTAAKVFATRLMLSGVQVETLDAPTKIGAKMYPEHSIVIRCDQAYRPHILDMFEPQDYPNDFQYDGGPPNPPYDNAGYTLAYQMGVEFDRILEGLPQVSTSLGLRSSTVTFVRNAPGADLGALLVPQDSQTIMTIAAAMSKGAKVYRLKSSFDSSPSPAGTDRFPAGTFYIDLQASRDVRLNQLSGTFYMTSTPRPADAVEQRMPRIALYDSYGGMMPSGWTRYVFDTFGLPYTVVFPPDLDKGRLNDKFDVILFPSGAGFSSNNNTSAELMNDPTVPADLKARMGSMTAAKTGPILREYVEQGGHIVLIGGSSRLAENFGLPIKSVLTEIGPNGQSRRLPNTKFYVPGSVLQVRLDPTNELCYGLGPKIDVMFDDNDAYAMPDGLSSTRQLGWFETDAPLRSGWAWGQSILKNAGVMFDSPVGKGRVVVLTPEMTFRGQPYASFKVVFNSLLRAGEKKPN